MGNTAIGKITDSVTGWQFTGVRDSVRGFYISDVFHDSHHFASSIRVERVAVTAIAEGTKPRTDPDNFEFFGLGDCDEIDAPTIVKLAKGTTDPLGYYAPRFKATAKYRRKKLLGEADQTIDFTLEYLFTAYGKDPSHEPGGIISAARVYPTLTFLAPGITQKNTLNQSYRRVTAVQALFRLNFQLDNNGSNNQCGIFADLDDLSLLSVAANVKNLKTFGSSTFVLAEKPVPFDVAGKGVDSGASSGWNGPPGWDNIHQWSHPSKKTDDPNTGKDNQSFTPGLPWGAHCHWRWSHDVTAGALGLPGGPQYGGPQGAGTPLVDDRIRDQTIEFAIVDRTTWFDQTNEDTMLLTIDLAPADYLFTDFSKVWEYVHSPQLVMPSGDPVIYISTTAWQTPDRREVNWKDFYPGSGTDDPKVQHSVEYFVDDWTGTFFAHGIFFPHEDESVIPNKLRLVPGIKKMQYLPSFPTTLQWRR